MKDGGSHTAAPAARSFRGSARVAGGGGRLSERAVKGRDCETEFLGLWTTWRIEVSCWAFLPRLMGPDSAEYTGGQQGSRLVFLLTERTALCWDCDRLLTCASLPFTQCMLGKTPSPE